MWKATHFDWCKDDSTYLTINTLTTIETTDGEIIREFESEPQGQCNGCGAFARWTEELEPMLPCKST